MIYKKDRPCEEYHENGNPFVNCTYKNGQLDGPYEEYYENGNLKLKSTYKNGEPVVFRTHILKRIKEILGFTN